MHGGTLTYAEPQHPEHRAYGNVDAVVLDELDGLIAQLNMELNTKGYFHPPSRTEATKNTLRTIFTKAGWSSREVKAIRGVIRALVGQPRSR